MDSLHFIQNCIDNLTEQDIERFKDLYNKHKDTDYQSDWIFIKPI